MFWSPKFVHEAPFMLQLVHHSLVEHGTARLALLPKAETKRIAKISGVKQQILHCPINWDFLMQYASIISNIGSPAGQ
jgi:hypothetical protein